MNATPQLIVSLHDVHPQSLQRVQRQREDLSRAGVTATTHLIVPEFHHGSSSFEEPSLQDWISNQQKKGDEMVLHGYYHDRIGLKESVRDLFWTRLYTNQEAEFYSLDVSEACKRWKQGLDGFQKNNWGTAGFIAPAWLLSSELIGPLSEIGFQYTVTYDGVWILKKKGDSTLLPIKTLCWSSRAFWRRQTSLIWNGVLFQILLSRRKDIRVSLHPNDIEYPLLWNQIMTMVGQLIRAGYRPMTYLNYLSNSLGK